ncbi:hypothetical protein SAMN05216436_10155 [bacterium A37T11]|nr:hypothetical protein SAMN05216436_10155 [bacterium A37T11]
MTVAASCGKDNATSPSLEDGKSTVIYDLAGDTQASVAGGVDGKENRPFYSFLFRFNDKKHIWLKTKADSTQWLQTADWDIAFTATITAKCTLTMLRMPVILILADRPTIRLSC